MPQPVTSAEKQERSFWNISTPISISEDQSTRRKGHQLWRNFDVIVVEESTIGRWFPKNKKICYCNCTNILIPLWFSDDQSPIRKGRQLWGNFDVVQVWSVSRQAAKNVNVFFVCDIFKWNGVCYAVTVHDKRKNDHINVHAKTLNTLWCWNSSYTESYFYWGYF